MKVNKQCLIGKRVAIRFPKDKPYINGIWIVNGIREDKDPSKRTSGVYINSGHRVSEPHEKPYYINFHDFCIDTIIRFDYNYAEKMGYKMSKIKRGLKSRDKEVYTYTKALIRNLNIQYKKDMKNVKT